MNETDSDVASGRKHWSEDDHGELHLGQRGYCGICAGVAISNTAARAMRPLLQERDALRAQLAEAKSVLALVEWSDSSACPVCHRYRATEHAVNAGHDNLGHAQDCRLAKVIGT